MTAAPDWHVGDEFSTAQRRRYRITAIIDVNEPDSRYKGFFEVSRPDSRAQRAVHERLPFAHRPPC